MARKPVNVRAFVHEYVWGEHAGNATDCARVAGLCKGNRKSQAQYGCRLLRKPGVRELVDKELAEKELLLKQKALRVAEETFALATVDIGDAFGAEGELLPVGSGFLAKDGKPLRMPAAVRRSIASIEVETRQEGRGEDAETYVVTKLKLHDKRAAQELFLKYSGKLKDKVEVEASEQTLEAIVLSAEKIRRAREAAQK